MNAERYKQVDKIFQEVVDLDTNQRAAFLDRACAGDHTLRADVELLLAANDQAGSFIKSPVLEAAAGFMAESQADALSGRSIGPYKVLSLIGAGGMGEVYLAEDGRLGRKVALKLLPDYFVNDEDRLNRFKREARAASSLNHPNIVTIFDIGQIEGAPYIATEYIQGETLRERLSSAKISISESLEIASQIASALEAAHGAGIVHRDIKPENIMLRPDGYVKLLDFGLAKLTERKQPVAEPESATTVKLSTSPGIVMGTVTYMSPEQARGQKVDWRTDIFSLGVVLYEMAAGRPPFDGETTSDLIAAILTKEPPPLASRSEGLPETLELIVAKALKKERDERYQTAAEMLADLRGLKKRLELEAESSRADSPTVSVASSQGGKAKSKLTLSKAALLALVAVGLIVGFIVWRASRARQAPPEAANENVSVQKNVPITNWPGLDTFPALSPDGNSIAYSSDHNGSFQIYIKQLTPGSREIQLTSDGRENLTPAWSPDGQRIAYYSKDRGGIWVVPSSGGQARQLTEFGSRPAWSRDGSMIAFQSSGISNLDASVRTLAPSTIWVVSAQGGEAKPVTQVGNPPGGHGAPGWSPDGKRIAFESGETALSAIWSVSVTGNDLKQILPAEFKAYTPVFSPDGKRIYVAAQSGGLWQVPIAPQSGEAVGEPTQISGVKPSIARNLTISADGKKMAHTGLLQSSNIWSVPLSPNSGAQRSAPIQITHDTSARNSSPLFSPDGRKIAYTSSRPSGDVWVMDSDGKNPVQVTTDPAADQAVGWFPEMDQIAFASRRGGQNMLYAMALANGKESVLFDKGLEMEYGSLSPDGRQFVFNCKKDGVINICAIQLEGGQTTQLTFDKELMGWPCWSPDGRYIAFEMKRGDDTHVAFMPSGGGAITQLTFDRGDSWPNSWAPDGDKIVFAGKRNGYWNLYWVSRTTGEVKQLTNYSKLNAFVRYPAWSPIGDQIVYEYTETTGNIWLIELK